MEMVQQFIDIFVHLDKHLAQVIAQFGNWTYFILFLIIFCETGLVVTPFLPGDSLLFTAGAFAALPDGLSVWTLWVLLIIAAFIGDTLNYWIGRRVGPKIFTRTDVRFLNRKHLERTHQFYERHGGKTIIIARFVPIIRTFAPFVAGIGEMGYVRFMTYNVVGGVLWVTICLFAGYFFGNLPFVQKNFSVVILGIIFVSVLPGVIEILRERARAKKETAAQAA